MPDQNQILLQTKLHPPHLPRDLVIRTRLHGWLNHDIDRPLILVYAPAGFGKTALIGTWLERMRAGEGERVRKMPSAWLSLDENDSDFNLFLRYFIAALRTIFNDACLETLDLLQARQQPPLALINATLCNELEKLPEEFILILDDYHTIHNMEIHNLLGDLVKHWPDKLHLVLISRMSPPLPLGSFRAKGMISEIRTRDLRFTQEETISFLSQSQFALMIQQVLPLLEERFEGWPAGLHLAALSIRSTTNQESIIQALSSENSNITGYLLDQVLSQQVPAVHTFLLSTSILDRFCAALCEAILEGDDETWNARSCLDWIERSELFIISLDNRREWYRYHHLFQQLLQQRASAEMASEQVSDLHHRASTWFEEQGLFDEALHHALAAGDLDLVMRQMNAGLCDVLNREDRPTLERWLRLLPEEMIPQRPELLMIKAWALEYIWRVDLQAQVLQQVEELLDSQACAALPADELQLLRGQILSLRAQQAYFSNQLTQAIDLCRQVLAILPASWTFVRGGAMMYLGMAMQASGQASAAKKLLLDEYESYGDKVDSYSLFLLLSLGFIYLNTGQLEQAKQIAQILLKGSTRSRITIMESWGEWFLGLICYQRNELETAAQHFTWIVENHYTAQIATYRDAIAGLAMIHQFKGESTEARRMVESISQVDLEQRGSEDMRTRSLRARLMLLQGDLEGAGHRVDTITDLPPDQPLLWFEEPQMTWARVLVARGADSDLRLGLQILDVLDEIAERTHNTRYKIETLALRALALDTLRKGSEANCIVKQALDLSRPGGFIRVFVDLGKPMQKILKQLAEQGYSDTSLNRILAAYPELDKDLVNNGKPAQPGRNATADIPAMAERLTPRELEVLTLLRGPLSIKEIAHRLNISYATAKRHTINIYGKLGVNQRWNAVDKAISLKILPPG
jgi:LuxR family maltose regulon positive regulatory protein